MSQRTIKPAAPGLVVRRPENGKRIADQGEPVEWNAHWQRRLNEGDVVEVEAVPNTAQEQPQVEQPSADTSKKGGAK